MKTLHYPVLTWEDPAGGWTACLADDFPEPAAHGVSEEEVVGSVREGLVRLAEIWGGWLPTSSFVEPRLLSLAVAVRVRHRSERRLHASHELVVRVDCVQGAPERGLHVCAIPRLGIRFDYESPADFRDLVRHFVRESLRDEDPGSISTRLPQRSVRLREIAVRARSRGRKARRAELRHLPLVADPLTERTFRARFSPAWEREDEVRRLAERIGRDRASVLLVGEPGCGKSTILVEAARRLFRAEPREPGAPARFWTTRGGRLVAGLPYLGQWQERCEAVVAELSRVGGVLCVEGLFDLLRSGGSDPRSGVAAFLVPYVESGELRLVVEATPGELALCRTVLPGFADVLAVESIEPLDRARTVRVLQRLAEFHATHHGIEVEPGAPPMVVHLFRRFQPYAALPGPAARFLGDLFERARRDRAAVVDRSRVLEGFRRRTGLPETFLRDDVPLDPAVLEGELRARVRGQDAACRTVADVVATFKAALNDPERPVATLLFTGPTGVGKTALARALAATLFGHGEDARRLVRLDMSEYAGPWAVGRLLGGDSGPDRAEGELLRRVREQPFVVVLLDEIEKAAPEVFDALLGLLDEGRLTDPTGRTTWFRSAIVVLTSNLGARTSPAAGFAPDPAADYEAAALAFFRPEFANRIDEIVRFAPLGPDTVREIVETELAALQEREGLARACLRLAWSAEVPRRLAEIGFDERYGARPLQRAIEAGVVVPISRFLVEHPGLEARTLRLEWKDGAVVVEAADVAR